MLIRIAVSRPSRDTSLQALERRSIERSAVLRGTVTSARVLRVLLAQAELTPPGSAS